MYQPETCIPIASIKEIKKTSHTLDMKQPLFRPKKKPSLRYKQHFLLFEWNQPPLISRQFSTFSGKNDHPMRRERRGEMINASMIIERCWDARWIE